jgi:hypothetical protein
MVAVKSEDESKELIEMGYKPYYHRCVGKWYLKRGRRRRNT